MIDSFTGEYRFLSNFYPSPVSYMDIWFPTVEHAYVASKILPPDLLCAETEEEWKDYESSVLELWLAIANTDNPGTVKKLGKKLPLRKDWQSVRVSIMTDLVTQKFQDSELLAKLKATAPNELVEKNTWHDTFWGVCNGEGENNLGKLLMAIRDSA